ncbi:MAG TPA: alpha/beta fold hydrolase [Anaerolineales bacterium]|nr:alpha/beta fold hydrolase [Anaerolineales bacterium]
MNKNRTYWTLLTIALVLMLGGSLLGSWINTGAGAATVTDIKIHGTNGYVISAYLYTPKTASAQKPAPAILAFHGLNNQKDYMSNTALEFARRGFVVLSADMSGHGYSTGANGDNGYDGPDALAYLRSLAVVDKNNIGMIGMSQGGFGPVTAAANAMPDAYTSIFYMESECTPPGAPILALCKGLKNVAFNEGQITELGVMILVAKGSQAPTSPVLQPVFNTKDPIVAGKVYGSIADGSARILYQPWEDHAGSTDSPAAIGNAIDWMQQTLKGGTPLPPSNQVWGWKVFGTAAALLGALLFLFPMGALLLQTTFFKPLAEPTPEYKGFKGLGWWIGALITTALGPLLYIWVWQNMFFTPWIPANTLWPQNFTNIYMVWAAIVGIIAIALILLNHFVFTKKQGATAVNYGLTWEDNKPNWEKVWKSLLLAICILVPLYLLLEFINSVWMVDFRAWVVALMPMNSIRFTAFLGYLIPFAIYYVPQGILFAGFLRVKEGKASLGREMVVNAIMLTLGVVVWLLMMYVPIMAGGVTIFGTGPMGPTAAGLGGIYYIPMVVLWPVVTCLYTYFFRKTGKVYTGIFLVTLFMVWYLAAFGVFAVMP